MYSVMVTNDNYETKIYNLTLTTHDIRTLYQIGMDINTLFNHMPTLEELCLFFTICLQSTNVTDGETFVDDYLNEHSMEDLMSIVPPFFSVVIGINEPTETEGKNMPSDVHREPISIVKILDDYLLASLELGLTESEFNSMTLAEVKRWIEAHEKRKLRELKEQAIIEYISCDLIATSIGRIFSKDVKYPTFELAYSNLFTKEELEQIEQDRARRKREATIEQLKAMAKAHNDRFEVKQQTEE